MALLKTVAIKVKHSPQIIRKTLYNSSPNFYRKVRQNCRKGKLFFPEIRQRHSRLNLQCSKNPGKNEREVFKFSLFFYNLLSLLAWTEIDSSQPKRVKKQHYHQQQNLQQSLTFLIPAIPGNFRTVFLVELMYLLVALWPIILKSFVIDI